MGLNSYTFWKTWPGYFLLKKNFNNNTIIGSNKNSKYNK